MLIARMLVELFKKHPVEAGAVVLVLFPVGLLVTTLCFVGIIELIQTVI